MRFPRTLSLALLLAVLVAGSGVVAHHPAARAASLAACGIDQIANNSTDARRVGDAVVGVTALGTWGTSPCVLHAHLRFAVKPVSDRSSDRGAIAGIRGNPAVVAVNVVVRPGSVVVASWRWRNWCGARGRVVLQAAWGAPAAYDTMPSQPVRPPACTSSGSRSRLVRTTPSVPKCTSADYTATTSLGQPFEGAMIPFVRLAPRNGSAPPCLVEGLRVSFAVQGETASRWTTLGSVKGNGASRKLGVMLAGTHGTGTLLWAWRNWCGQRDAFRPAARLPGRTVVGSAYTQGATCFDGGAPSTLTPSFGHP